MQDHIHSAVSDAINALIKIFVWALCRITSTLQCQTPSTHADPCISVVQDHIHSAVSDAINASVETFVSPFLEQAADAMDSASDVIERLPSAFLDKAFSKSLDVVTPFERMAR